ncbi:TIGR03089 family protein [Streptomyces sp. SID4948]|nr:TIGR03089 family protein [Streptomyces sp. SID4948]
MVALLRGATLPVRPIRVDRITPGSLTGVTPTTRTPAALLADALRADSGRPLVTFYDDETGERVELSTATFANWVAKTANLLQDDLGAQPGDRLALLLPAHWQTAAWVLAAFSAGVVVAPGGDPAEADLVVSGPDTLEAARACRGERVALALRPLGGRFPQPPAGFSDYAVEVPSQGDRFAPYVPVGPDAPALQLPGDEGVLTGGEVVERALASARALGLSRGSRLLSGLSYDTWDGLAAGLLAPLAADASVVLCRHLDALPADRLARRVDAERVTHTAGR